MPIIVESSMSNVLLRSLPSAPAMERRRAGTCGTRRCGGRLYFGLRQVLCARPPVRDENQQQGQSRARFHAMWIS